MSGFVKDQKPLWAAAFGQAGLDVDEHIKSSGKHPTAHELPMDDKTKEEFSISTQGLLCPTQFWHDFRRGKSDRDLVRSCLDIFLGQVFSPGEATATCEVEGSHCSLCQERVVIESGMCCHMQDWHAAAAEASQGVAPQRGLTSVILAAGPRLHLCPAWGAHATACCSGTADFIEASLDSRSHSNPMKTKHMEGKTKRMRYDEDFKHCVAAKCLEEKKARSSGAYLKAHGSAPVTNVPHWVEADLCNYTGACRLAFQRASAVCVAADCTRIGKPAEETLRIVAWSPEIDRRAILPPQACFLPATGPQTLTVCHPATPGFFLPATRPQTLTKSVYVSWLASVQALAYHVLRFWSVCLFGLGALSVSRLFPYLLRGPCTTYYHYVPMGWQALIVVWLVLCWSCSAHTPLSYKSHPAFHNCGELLKIMFFAVITLN